MNIKEMPSTELFQLRDYLRSRVHLSGVFVFIIILCVVILSCFVREAPFIVVPLFWIFLVLFGHSISRFNKCRFELDTRTSDIPPDKMRLAYRLYGHEDGVKAALECEECHLGGECLLCGAE